MNDCISHSGAYDDEDNPLTETGELYLPGARTCGHRDCVNPNHLEGSGYVPVTYTRERWDRRKAAQSYQVILEIGENRQARKGSPCHFPKCNYPIRARALCQNHLATFYRISETRIDKMPPLTAEAIAQMPPALSRTERAKSIKGILPCLVKNCPAKNVCRGLCHNHYTQFSRLQNKETE